MRFSSAPVKPTNQASRAWYGAAIDDFLHTACEAIVGKLVENSNFALRPTQTQAWLAQIRILQDKLSGFTGSLFLEFDIPRMGRRIDAVILIGPVVFVIEFKTGDSVFDRAAVDQTWDYSLDLKNFHEASHDVTVVPILIATGALESAPLKWHIDEDKVYRPISVHIAGFRKILECALRLTTGNSLNAQVWSQAPYHPTPTIVEAAQSLYAQHSVDAITRYDAGAINLRITSNLVEDIIDQSKNKNQKVICFVTGVPGSGKTLVGLNIATRRRRKEEPTHAVFLSGNGPLVKVLREALIRDEVSRKRSQGNKVRKGQVGESVKAFIQNVHHFRDDALFDTRPPFEHVAIFDEAQRAWNLLQTANFMKRRKNFDGFSQSEPEFLISCMDRHPDWAVILCLVGGGQEINRGEAGIGTWLDVLNSRFRDWHVYISPRLTDSEYAAQNELKEARKRQLTHYEENLHLAVSMRSFRAENVSTFVKTLLDCERKNASDALKQLFDRFPIVITRDLNRAKWWVRNRARGTERYGLVASSKAQRLKPHAIDVRIDVNPVHWFLNDKEDTRSSFYLEDAATEFQVQGLELDWVCVS